MRTFLLTVVFTVLLCSKAISQVSYEPLSQRDVERLGRLLIQNKVSGLLTDNYISLAGVDLGPIEHFLSYNPLEGARLRLSGRTNTSLSKRFALSGILAYGTNDKKLKYEVSLALSLKRKPKGVYSFPANAISIFYSDNSHMPNLANYDALYYSIGKNTNYSLEYRRSGGLKYLYEFPNAIGISPFANISELYSKKHYSYGEVSELLSSPYRYASAGMELYFKPERKKAKKNSLNARLQPLTSELSLNFTHNIFLNSSEEYSKLSFLACERLFIGKRIAIDMRLNGGKIFGNTPHYFYFTPSQSLGLFSSQYALNLLSEQAYFYQKEYLQGFLQLNLGGAICDMLPLFKQWRMNEFVYAKALFGEYAPYYEVGFGLDNIFSCFGLEVIRSFGGNGLTEENMWGVRIRVK